MWNRNITMKNDEDNNNNNNNNNNINKFGPKDHQKSCQRIHAREDFSILFKDSYDYIHTLKV